MKKIPAILALIMAVVMLFSLSACGQKEEPSADPNVPATPGEPIMDLGGVEPESILNPTQVNMGQAIDEAHTGDAWYKDGVEGGDYIFFEAADNSDIGLAYVKVENGERAATILCALTEDLHVVDADAAEGQSSIELVFADDFKIFDYKTNTWYVRGDPEKLSVIFADIPFVCQDDETNTLLLRSDGSGTEMFQGQEDELTWMMDSATTVKYNDGNFDHILQIVVDENGKLISLSEQNFRIFVPAAAE